MLRFLFLELNRIWVFARPHVLMRCAGEPFKKEKGPTYGDLFPHPAKLGILTTPFRCATVGARAAAGALDTAVVRDKEQLPRTTGGLGHDGSEPSGAVPA